MTKGKIRRDVCVHRSLVCLVPVRGDPRHSTGQARTGAFFYVLTDTNQGGGNNFNLIMKTIKRSGLHVNADANNS